MEASLFDSLHLKRVRAGCCWLLAIVTALYLATYALYVFIISDIIYQTTVLPLILETLLQVFGYLFYWVGFGYLIYAFLRFSKKEAMTVAAIYAAASLLRTFLGFVVYGFIVAFPTWNSFSQFYLGELIFTVIMDLCQAALVYLFVYLCARSVLSKQPQLEVARSGGVFGFCYPCKELFSRRNPLYLLCLEAALLPSAISLLSRLYFDLAIGGMPNSISEILVMLIYYFSDIAAIAVAYFIILLIQNRLFLAQQELQRELSE